MRAWVKRVWGDGLSRRGLSLVRKPRFLCENPEACLELDFEFVLCHYLMHQERVPYFVQVGAFDGISGDPIHPYVKKGLLRGCLLEPQFDAFEQLRSNYAGCESVTFKRAAIGAQSGEATLYRVRPGTPGPDWLYQIASFRRDVLLRHAPAVPGLEEAIITESVPVITFEELFAELNTTPDIVVIDTEGFDFEVIKLLNVAVNRPSMILYEYKHLSREDQNACVELLAGYGYRTGISGVDMVAYRTD